jgi:hypothetical protein
MRFILIYIASGDRPQLESMRAWPGVEVYRLHPGPGSAEFVKLCYRS